MTTPPESIERHRRARELFEALADLDRGEQRRRLAELDEPQLVERVTALLGWDSLDRPAFLDRPLALPEGALPVPSYTGLRIGPYVLGELLGEGGTGTVYRAERRDDQFDQHVAIKLIRRDLASPIARRRFRTEQQILATLNHPNIARLLDGGTTPEGIPFVVLELIEGIPITDYCDRHELNLAPRLVLFRQVADAVHYAHRHLVVHRDIKPSNVLVSDEGQPKLLDFGIAKLLDSTIPDRDQTATEYRALTPAYASPEQLLGETVTVASDIYSLGVVLYELVTGLRPYQRGTDSPAQLAARLQKDPPPTPSRALSEVDADTATRLAECRGLERNEHRLKLRGDLDRVVSMAMTADPERRYDSARELSQDVDRYLTGLPVIARPPTWNYRLGKAILRHPVAFPLGVVALVLILGFALTTAVQSDRLRRERDAALAAERLADRERERAEAITDFLQQAFLLADPTETRGENLTALEVLERSAERVLSDLSEEPTLQADLLETLADVLIGLGGYDRAGELAAAAVVRRRSDLEMASEPATEVRTQLAKSLEVLGMARLFQQRFADADALFGESLGLWTELEEGEGPRSATSLFYLAYLRQWQGRQAEAEAAAERALELRRQSPESVSNLEVADSRYLLGQILITSEDPSAAVGHLEESRQRYEAAGSGYERKAITALHTLGRLQHQLGQKEIAQETLRQAIDRSRNLLGRHPMLADELISWAGLLREQGEWNVAEEALREAVAIYEEAGGEDDDLVIAGLVHLGHHLMQSPDLEAARMPLEEALERSKRTLAPEDPRHASILSNLLSLFVRLEDFEAATNLCREVIPLRRRLILAEADTPSRLAIGLGNSLVLCGEAEARRGRLTEGRRHVEEAKALLEQEGADWRVAVANSVLGSIATNQGQIQQGLALLESAAVALEELRPGSHYTDAARRRLDQARP